MGTKYAIAPGSRHGKTEELFNHADGKKFPKLTTPTGLDLDAHACNFTREVLEMSSRKGFRLPPSKLISRPGGKRKVGMFIEEFLTPKVSRELRTPPALVVV